MMRIRFAALTVVLGLLGAGAAMAQDAPPPGCRWQGYQGETILACKDGRGNWRRSGDDMKVGTYPMPKPKPKPKPVIAAAKPAAAAVSAPASAADAPAAKAAKDVGTPALAQGERAPAIEATAPSADDAAVDASAAGGDAESAPATEPAPVKPPWWKSIWDAILDFFRMIGLLK